MVNSVNWMVALLGHEGRLQLTTHALNQHVLGGCMSNDLLVSHDLYRNAFWEKVWETSG